MPKSNRRKNVRIGRAKLNSVQSEKVTLKEKNKTFVFILPIICFFLFLTIKIIWPQIYEAIIQEDSIVEDLQFFAFFSASILAFIISIRFINNRFILHGIMYLILFMGLMFVSMEEISWGQRIFNITTHGYFATHNGQKEINLHNIPPQIYLHLIYVLIGFYGTFAWLCLRVIKTTSSHIINFVIPEWFISSYFWAVLLIYSYFEFMMFFGVQTVGIDEFHVDSFVLWRDQEPAELLLSLGFLIFTIVNNMKSKTILSEITSTRT